MKNKYAWMTEKIGKPFLAAALAGCMIGVGGMVFLSCENRYVGAALFCVGLFAICTFGLYLFTGRVGYLPDNRAFLDIFVTWAGNYAGTLLAGLAAGTARPKLAEAARTLCEGKLAQQWPETLILAFFCGILMYVAVDSFKRGAGAARYLGMLLAVPAFILSGCEHSVADMFYLALGGCAGRGFGYVLLVSAGNALGAMVFHWIFTRCVPKTVSK